MKISILCLSVFSLLNSNSIKPIFNIEGDGDDSSTIKLYSLPIPSDDKLGNAAIESEKEKGIAKVGKDLNGEDVYSLSNYYVLYKYPKIASCIVEDLDSCYHSLNAGSDVSLTYSISSTTEVSFGTQISNSISKIDTETFSINVGYGYGELKDDISEATEYTSSIGLNLSCTYSTSITQTISVNYHVNEDGTYRLTKRGLFDVYVYQHLKAIYNVNKAVSGGKIYTKRSLAYYTLEKTNILFSLKDNSISDGLYKYYLDSSEKHKIDESYASKYLDYTDVVFLD